MISLRVACLALLFLFPAVLPVKADPTGATAGFRLLLGAVPRLPAEMGAYQVDYGDARAAAALLALSSGEPADDPEAAARAALMRAWMPIFEQALTASDAEMRAVNGFGFEDVDASLQLAHPPVFINLVSLGLGRGGQVAAALAANGFDPVARPGVAAFQRGAEDFGVMLPGVEPHDIYSGPLRSSARVIVAGDLVAFSRAWGVVDSLLTPDFARMTEDPALAALLDAIDMAAGPDAQLVRAVLFVGGLPVGWPGEGQLLIADLFTPGGLVTLAALLPASGRPPSDQAADLQAAWSSNAMTGDGRSMAQIVGADASVEVSGTDTSVLILRIDTALPTTPDEMRVNRAAQTVIATMQRRDFERLLTALAP